jgi:hypothetical protein
MKVNVELDCTPEEMRRLMGLPDLTPVHEAYVQQLAGMMAGAAVKPEAVEAMMKSWAPMSEAGMGLWRKLMEAGAPK